MSVVARHTNLGTGDVADAEFMALDCASWPNVERTHGARKNGL